MGMIQSTRRAPLSWALIMVAASLPTVVHGQEPEPTTSAERGPADANAFRAMLLTSYPGATPDDIARTEREGSGITYAIEAGLQLFAQYRLTWTEAGHGPAWFHEFDLSRAWGFISMRVDDVIGRILVEGTRAGGEGALLGVGGDSVVLRFREAWVGYRLLDLFELRAGLVPTLTAPLLTRLWGMRAVSQIGMRELELMQPADTGVTLRFDIPEGFGSLGAAYYNGEGYRGRELNRGKTLELTAVIHPLAFERALLPLQATLAYQMGSTGTGSARADRLVGGVAWDDPRWGIGLERMWVLGIQDRGERAGVLIDGWGRVEPIDEFPLLVAARFSHYVMDLQAATTTATLFTLAVGYRIAAPLRMFAAVDRRFADAPFESAVPGFERWNVRLILEGNLMGRFEGMF